MKVGLSQMELRPLYKRLLRSPFLLALVEAKKIMEDGHLWARKLNPYQTLNLWAPWSWTSQAPGLLYPGQRNKMTVACKPPSIWYFCHSNPERRMFLRKTLYRVSLTLFNISQTYLAMKTFYQKCLLNSYSPSIL